MTVRASVDTEGGDPDRESLESSISANGRYVSFQSYATDLIPADGNGLSDIFVRDLVAGTTIRASEDIAGGDSDGDSTTPSISATGWSVAFGSYAADLVPGDGNGLSDVFVRDLVAGTTDRASLDLAGGDPDGHCSHPSISATGRYVAFDSLAADLIPADGNGFTDVYVRDLVAGLTVRASVDTSGGDPDDASFAPSISPDGRYVAFWSGASDLVPGDGNGSSDIFVRDLAAGTTVRVSVDTSGGDPDSHSFYPSISATGRFVAFESFSSDLVPGDGNGLSDVFVRDLVAGTTVWASVAIGGDDANGHSSGPSINATGRYVAFESYATTLVSGDGNGFSDVFVRDLVARTTVRASVDIGGADPNRASRDASISATGRYVAFLSGAYDLVPDDGNGYRDVFVRRMT